MAFKAILAVGILALIGGAGVFMIQVLEDRGAERVHRSHLVRALNAETAGRSADAESAAALITDLRESNAALADRNAERNATIATLEAAPAAGSGAICPVDCVVE